MRKTRLANVCRREMAEAGNFYRITSGEDAAIRCIDALVNMTRKIAANPLLGSAYRGGSSNLRQRRVTKYPYHFYYTIDRENGDVFIFMLRHAAQKPYAASTLRRIAGERKGDAGEI